MAQQSMLMGLLKTPSQVRQEQQEKLAQDAYARSQQMIVGGGTTALPGIISRYGAQAAQRGAMAGAGLLRGVAGGLGTAVGGDMGQRIADLGVSAEERQARAGQEAISNIKPNDPVSIRAAAQQLKNAGLMQAAAQLEAQALRVETAQKEAELESQKMALKEREVAAKEQQANIKQQEFNVEQQATETLAQRSSDVAKIVSQINFDPSNIVKYYTDQADALSKAGFIDEANEAIESAIQARDNVKSGDTAAITNFKAYQNLTPDQKLDFQLANGRILDPDTARQLEQAKTEGRTTGKEIATRLLSFDERISTADQMLSVVQELPEMEGFESAVGLSAKLPTFRPSTADFEIKLEQLKGQAFLEQFSKLRGAGAITEKEGTAAASALTALSSDRALEMSEERFLEELKTLKGVLNAAKERAAKGLIAPGWTPKDSYIPTEETKVRKVYDPKTKSFVEKS